MALKDHFRKERVATVAIKGEVQTAKSTLSLAKLKNILDIYGLSSGDKINIIRKGVSKKQLTDIKTEIELDYDQLSGVLATSRATLINKKNAQKFDPQVSERIVLLTDVLGYGREVFGNNDNFNEWLKTPSEAIGNVTPLSLMDTLYGIDEVKKEIGRIAYGVY